MIVGIGVDIVEVKRVAETLEKHGERFERRIFTEEEVAYCRSSPPHAASRFAARFAAKEAFSKALGTGITGSIRWSDIGVSREPSGRPVIVLTGETAERCAGLTAHLSISHTAETAIATVILEEK
jgi:holo-[acyl-carrier protein] synthase